MPLQSLDDVFESIDERRRHPSPRDRWLFWVYYPTKRFWTDYNPVQILREVKWFIQRGRRGWADCDTWSLNSYLCDWMPSALRHLAKHTHGYPDNLQCDDCEPDPSLAFFRPVGLDEDLANEPGYIKWVEMLEQMAQGFEALNKADGLHQDELGPYPGRRPADKTKEEWEVIKDEHFLKLRELEQRDIAKFETNIQIFVKYFCNLWD